MRLLENERVTKKLRKIVKATETIRPPFNLHELVDDLTKYLNLTPEQQFRVTAKIKRHVHEEKEGLYFRIWLHAKHKNRVFKNFLKEKYLSHKSLAVLPDEKVVTWNVGSHAYKSDPMFCSTCSGEIGKGYRMSIKDGVKLIECLKCSPLTEEEREDLK
jgi:hypothetical protein